MGKAQIPLSSKAAEEYNSLPPRGRGDIMSARVDVILSLLESGYSMETLKILASKPIPDFPSSSNLADLLNAVTELVKAGFDIPTLHDMCDPKLAFILKATTGQQFKNTQNPLLLQAMIAEFANFIGMDGVVEAKSLMSISEGGRNTSNSEAPKQPRSPSNIETATSPLVNSPEKPAAIARPGASNPQPTIMPKLGTAQFTS